MHREVPPRRSAREAEEAMFNPFLFVLGILAIIFSVPLLAILTEHRRKVLEMQMRLRNAPSEEMSNRLRELTKEIADLRATTTEYDLSFDAALERLSARIESLERRVQALESRRVDIAAEEVRNTFA